MENPQLFRKINRILYGFCLRKRLTVLVPEKRIKPAAAIIPTGSARQIIPVTAPVTSPLIKLSNKRSFSLFSFKQPKNEGNNDND